MSMKMTTRNERAMRPAGLSLIIGVVLLMLIAACGGGVEESGDDTAAVGDEAAGEATTDGTATDEAAGEAPTDETATDEAATDDVATNAEGDAAGGESFAIKVGHVLAVEEPIHQELLEVAERIAERTDGQVTLDIFPNSELGGNRDIAEQALLGAAIMGHMDPGYASEHAVPAMSILNGPFLFEDAEQLLCVTDSELFEGWEDQLLEDGDLVSVAWNWYFGQRHIIANAGFPQPADLQGVKIRVPPNPSWIETFEALPTTPVTLEWSEVYTGLSQGVVDAAEAPLSTLKGSSLYEVADTISLTGHFKALTGFLMGRTLWEQLSPEYQEIIVEEFHAGGERVTETTIAGEDTLKAELTELGVSFEEDVDTEAYTEAVQPFYSAFPEWPDGLYDEVQAAIAEC